MWKLSSLAEKQGSRYFFILTFFLWKSQRHGNGFLPEYAFSASLHRFKKLCMWKLFFRSVFLKSGFWESSRRAVSPYCPDVHDAYGRRRGRADEQGEKNDSPAGGLLCAGAFDYNSGAGPSGFGGTGSGDSEPRADICGSCRSGGKNSTSVPEDSGVTVTLKSSTMAVSGRTDASDSNTFSLNAKFCKYHNGFLPGC